MASIFLSHSSQDNEVAGDLSRRLKEHGYDSLFLDFDPDSGIKGGRDWERELYRNLKLARAVIVLCSPSSMASRWCFVEIAQAKALGKAIFPVTISPCRVESILNDRQVIDLTAVGADEAYRRLFDGLRAAGLDPGDSFHWDPRRPPFPGLNYFDAQDAGIYFGREDEVRQVIETLTRLRRQGEPRLLVVVGSSGSGKSSLIRAGVLPRLGKDRSNWALVDPFRPGTDPIRELARSLSQAFPEGPSRPDWKAIRDRLRDDSHAALLDYADDLTMMLGHREASMLIVVDQAEELLRTDTGDEASAFLRVLRRATEQPGGRVFGLLTLRSDFLGSFQNHPALRNIAFADLPLGLLPVENFPQVIEGPADRAEIALEPGLVSSMIADARTDDALPLLAFTLREMYERCRKQERLTLKVYRDDLGGIKGAVARVVERIKAESTWTPEVGRAMRRAFLKLVRVNDEGQFTRQPCRWADLPDQAAPVLEAFVKARLLSSNGDVVEVTHESLFRVWPELAGWLDEGRELILWRRNLQNEVEAWIAHDRLPLYLLSGARVAEGRRWLASNSDDFAGPEAEFITASIKAEDARVARELAQQEKLRRLTRNLSVGVVVASVFALLAIVLAVTAIRAREAESIALGKAKDQARKANQSLSDFYAERGRTLEDGGDSRGLLWLAKALLTTPEDDASRQQATRILLSVWGRKHHALKVIFQCKGGVHAVAFSPDGKTVLTGSWDETARLWNAADGSPVGLPMSHQGPVYDVAFSPDGKTILTGSGDKTARLWNAADGSPVGQTMSHQGYVLSVAFSPDGKTVLTGSGDKTARLWNAADGSPVGSPMSHQDSVFAVAFSPDGKTVLTGSLDKTARLWSAADGSPVGQAMSHQSNVEAVAFSPDGKTVLTGSGDKTARLWNAADGSPVGQTMSHQGPVYDVAFSPDGKTVLTTGSYDKTARLWNAADGSPVGLPMSHQDPVSAVAFSPDGKTVLTGSVDKTARLWNATDGSPVGQPMSHQDSVFAVAFSPDGKTVLTGSEDETARLWNAADGSPVGQTMSHQGYVNAVAFSPDSKTVLTGSEDKTARLWSAADGSPVGQAMSHQSNVEAVAFSPDGKTVLTGSGDKTARLWNAADGSPVGQTMSHQGPVYDVAFSPDGKTVLTGSYDKTARLWNAADGSPVGQTMSHQGYVLSVAFSPDGKTVLTGSDNTARLWSAADGSPVGQTMSHQGYVSAVAFSPDGKTVLTGSGDKTARLWNASDGSPVGQTMSHQNTVHRVAFSPDGKTVLTGSGDKTARLWNAADGSPVGSPMSHQDSVFAVAFSPDGKTVLTGSLDKTARLWSAADGSPVGPPMSHQLNVKAVAFSPDGKTVLTGSWDDTARLWHGPTLMVGDPRRLLLWSQVITGMEINQKSNTVEFLDAPTWQERRRELDALGGPPLP